MNDTVTKKMARTGLLLAATLILQGLRLWLPVPPQISLFVIGALVNACLIIAAIAVGWRAGAAVACITPVFAWLEGMLPFPLFILPVAMGNMVYVMVASYAMYRLRTGYGGVCGAAVVKTAVLYGVFYMLFSVVAFPDPVRHMILFAMSWPQLWTGFAGGILGVYISKRLHA